MYKILFLRSAKKDLAGIPLESLVLIKKRIALLTENPRPDGCVKLKTGGYRVRQGSYRILYQVDDEKLTIRIAGVKDRKEAYRKP